MPVVAMHSVGRVATPRVACRQQRRCAVRVCAQAPKPSGNPEGQKDINSLGPLSIGENAPTQRKDSYAKVQPALIWP